MKHYLHTSMEFSMEEPEEQCTVVFALIVTEPARVCVWGGLLYMYPPLPLASSVTIQAKTTVHCSPDSSMEFSIPPPD
jgi:hypothetical protein